MPEQNERPLLLQVGPLLPALQDALNSRHEVLRLWEAPDPSALLATRGGDVVALVTSGVHGATRELMSALPGLKAVFSFGVGYDSIDIAAARDLGVVVSNTPGVLDDCVADTAFALLIDVARGISAADRFVRRGDWQQGKFPLTSRLAGKTCGIVGLGNIGKSIARRVEAFGMEVAYHGRQRQPDVAYRYHADLEDLAKAADFLVLSLPGGPATDGLIDARILAALGPRGYLINIARGSVVDEPALVAALQTGALGGAGLDVFAAEPAVPTALLALDNVVLTPHLGSGTHETRQAMADLVLANVERYFAEGRLVTPV
ncbi:MULTISPECIES: 2-hydroxyacid dehydrogenase [unclassified Pseudomonas]|uniref:2-hydroxyacid dehydrogenase n=1 Tax=unclassified Pseudomonas TaxID=196821 RepID=UPI00236223C6|nr:MULTISPECIES: 2-hydroxyacid dehydrogenase [unclassified Pseudomonas]MDR6178023.1 hydroxypyruvate reductase [Pseudomonas sp. SORGH_AS_0211]